MSEETQTASAEVEPKPVQPLEQPQPKQDAQPASEPPVEEWDKERAAATIKAQRAEEKRLKEQLKDYERLKAEEQKRIEAQMTETERLQKQNVELAQKAHEMELSLMRRDVIAETGLPAVLAERLKGDDKESMLEDAKKLLESLPKPSKQPVQTVANPGGSTVPETEAQMKERIFGRQENVFEVKNILENGGGVIWNEKQ